jgi:signal transduction histidine kinase
MERKTGTLHLKVAATDFAVGGVRQRLISLQNVETELSAQELVAWQSVVRVMAHEVMNSLTPMTSLSATALDLVRSVLDKTPPGSPNTEALSEALLALETASSRSEALLHFVQNHRRLTKRLEAKIGTVRVGRLFAQLGRLLASELALRGIVLEFSVEPGNLEIAADADLLEQAFINLIRNAMEALGDRSDGRIELSSRRSPDGRTLLAVADNGPGIPLALNERVFVPFFTTKRHGSGVGLTLVRQIAMVHEATVGISETPGGGATISLRF